MLTLSNGKIGSFSYVIDVIEVEEQNEIQQLSVSCNVLILIITSFKDRLTFKLKSLHQEKETMQTSMIHMLRAVKRHNCLEFLLSLVLPNKRHLDRFI